MTNRNIVLTYATVLGMGLASSAAWSQTIGIEEIIVTAQKREESLQEIPKQVMVVPISQMENANITSIDELVRLIPSMNGDNSGDDVSMRGISTAAPSIGANNKVGITLDGIPIPSRATGVRTLLDIQQVEVLPGPQGTLAGRNATGGLLNLVTSRPNMDSFSGKAEAKVTSDNETGYGILLTGPITDNLAFSFSANKQDLRGQEYNLYTKKWDVEKDYLGLKAKLLWSPDEQTDVYFTYTNSSWKNRGPGGRFTPAYIALNIPASDMWSALERVPGAETSAERDIGTGKTKFDEMFPGLYERIGPNNRSYSSPGTSREDRDTDFATLTYEREVASGTFTVLGSMLDERFPRLQNWHDYALGDQDIRPDFDGYAHLINYSKQTTFEARFASNTDSAFSYIAGVWWSDGENRYDYERLYLPFSADRRFGTATKALFASTTYEFNDRTSLRAGLRYEQDDIDYSWIYRVIPATTKTTSDGIVLSFAEVSYPNNGSSDKHDDSYVNFDLGVTHHINDNAMAYLNFASANQGPIYDAEFIQGSQDGTPLEPLPSEEVESIEAGMKTTLLDGRMTLNFNVFSMDYTNYQALTNVTDPTDPTSQPILKTFAAGAVSSRGVEFNLQARVTDNFRVDFAGMFNKAEIDDWPNAPCYGGQTEAEGCLNGVPPGEGAVRDYQPNIAGNQLADASEIRLTAIGTYSGEMSAFGGMEYDLSLTLAHSGDAIGDQLGDPEDNISARTDVDVNLTFRRGPLSLSLFGVNLTEDAKMTPITGLRGALRAPGYARGDAVRYERRRSFDSYWGMRLKYDFGN